MEALECIKTRRSVRRFTDEKVTDEAIKEIVEAASYAPTWKNTQTIRYISISDKAMLDRIAAEGVLGFEHNSKIISKAHQLVLVTQVNGICGYEKDGSYSTSKEAGWEMFDAGIATQTFCLAAHDKGVGTVILGVFDDKIVGDIAGVPEGQTVAAVIAIGYPAFAPDMPPRKTVDELLTIR